MEDDPRHDRGGVGVLLHSVCKITRDTICTRFDFRVDQGRLRCNASGVKKKACIYPALSGGVSFRNFRMRGIVFRGNPSRQ